MVACMTMIAIMTMIPLVHDGDDNSGNMLVINNFLLLYDGDDDVQRSPPNPAPAGSSDARRCDDDGRRTDLIE